MMVAADGPKIVSNFEDPAGRKFSFLYTKGWVSLYDPSGDLIHSKELGADFYLLCQMVGISVQSIAFQWFTGCLKGARGF